MPSNIEVVWQIDASDAQCHIDPIGFQQVVLNLAVNARDAMADGGRLLISLEVRERENQGESQSDAILRVSDTGTGIPPEARSRLFEPFYTTKDLDRGTGLGLAVSYGIVSSVGGRIEVDTEVRSGTTFRVSLPVQRDAPPV